VIADNNVFLKNICLKYRYGGSKKVVHNAQKVLPGAPRQPGILCYPDTQFSLPKTGVTGGRHRFAPAAADMTHLTSRPTASMQPLRQVATGGVSGQLIPAGPDQWQGLAARLQSRLRAIAAPNSEKAGDDPASMQFAR
jgi:hypothetical protein